MHLTGALGLSCLILTLAAAEQGKPQIAATRYSDWDVPVILFDAAAKPFSADPTGAKDATGAIQATLDACLKQGGGTVYLPAGRYRIDGRLNIPGHVSLRGDWLKPTDQDLKVQGTVLEIYGGKGKPEDKATITINDCSAIRDLSIFYPEQTPAKPIPYPFTIDAIGFLGTSLNLTLVNPYQGLRYGGIGNNMSLAYVRNVYGTPLLTGLSAGNAVAAPRFENIHFAPSYWAGSGLARAPQQAEITRAIRALDSAAFRFGSSGGGMMIGNLDAIGYHTGIQIWGDSSTRMFDFTVRDCQIGLDAQKYKAHGWVIIGGKVEASGPGAIALRGSDDGLLQFNNCSFTSSERLVQINSGIATFVSCRFGAWRTQAAIESKAAQLLVGGCTFASPPAGGKHLHLDDATQLATVYGNTYTGAPSFSGRAADGKSVVIDTTSAYTFTPIDSATYTFAERPKLPKAANQLFNVRDFGAKGNALNDDTAAINRALATAGSAGGGTVFVPCGAYRINGHLQVPTAVELRGLHDVAVKSEDARSILLSYGDKGNANAPAMITLARGSGVRGLFIYRPEQSYNSKKGQTTIFNYPPAVKSAGPDCWAINLALGNTQKGVDFSVGGGHFTDWIYGITLDYVVKIRAEGTRPSVVENLMIKTDIWRTVRKMPWSDFTTTPDIFADTAPSVGEAEGLRSQGYGLMVEGDGRFIAYAHFFNGAGIQYRIDGSPTANYYMCGGEGDSRGFEVNAKGALDLEMVGNTYHTGAEYGMYNLGPKAKATLIACKSYGFPSRSYYASGEGRLILQQEFHGPTCPLFLEVDGNASALMEGCFLSGKSDERMVVAPTAKGSMIASLTPKGNIVRGKAQIEACAQNHGDRGGKKKK